MKELSVIKGMPYETSLVYEAIVSDSHTINPYFEMDDQPKENHTSSVSLESASCHLTKEESTKMEDIPLDYGACCQHAELSEEILPKSYKAPPYIKSRYCSRQFSRSHSSTHGSSLSSTDDLYQDFMNMPCEAQASSQGFYDPFASYLERSYREYIQQNGKIDLNFYSLLEVKGGKTVVIFYILYVDQFQFWLLTMVLILLQVWN